MVFVPGCKHDIFVSYAHADDQPDIESAPGWVSDLIRLIRNRLGRPEKFDVWMDFGLKGNDLVTPTIMEALAESALFLLIISPNYLDSVWCHKEFREFVRRRKQTGCKSQIFMVERTELERSEFPEELQDLKGYRFWIKGTPDEHAVTLGVPRPNPNEPEYWKRVDALVADLRDELKRQKLRRDQQAGQPASGTAQPVRILSKPTVFVAEVTDDLDSQREDLKAYLKQADLQVLSTSLYGYHSAEAFQQALATDLGQCKLFVQLLSAIPGKRPPNSPKSYAALQLESANAGSSEILQWRKPDLDLSKVMDEQHLKLLQGATVLAIGIEEFKAKVVERCREAEPPPVAPEYEDALFVFIITESSDRPVAHTIAQTLQRKQIGFQISAESKIRKHLREDLQLSDAAIIIYERSPHQWVEGQQREFSKVFRNLKDPPPLLAIYQGPPEPKELEFLLPKTMVIDCTKSGFSLPRLDEFLKYVRKRKRR
jgi:hypothetical protein